MTFNRKNFLLQSKVAEDLYRLVEKLPIEDFHCHLSPQEIFEDNPFENAVQVWLGGDHYKWRLMRANGVNERLITGMQLLKKNLKHGPKRWLKLLEILYITGAIWN